MALSLGKGPKFPRELQAPGSFDIGFRVQGLDKGWWYPNKNYDGQLRPEVPGVWSVLTSKETRPRTLGRVWG